MKTNQVRRGAAGVEVVKVEVEVVDLVGKEGVAEHEQTGKMA